jgi:hypothetical protein
MRKSLLATAAAAAIALVGITALPAQATITTFKQTKTWSSGNYSMTSTVTWNYDTITGRVDANRVDNTFKIGTGLSGWPTSLTEAHRWITTNKEVCSSDPGGNHSCVFNGFYWNSKVNSNVYVRASKSGVDTGPIIFNP